MASFARRMRRKATLSKSSVDYRRRRFLQKLEEFKQKSKSELEIISQSKLSSTDRLALSVVIEANAQKTSEQISDSGESKAEGGDPGSIETGTTDIQ